mgnify:CR=1 FL=1
MRLKDMIKMALKIKTDFKSDDHRPDWSRPGLSQWGHSTEQSRHKYRLYLCQRTIGDKCCVYRTGRGLFTLSPLISGVVPDTGTECGPLSEYRFRNEDVQATFKKLQLSQTENVL